ncbi:hypothetical protein ACFFRR_011053 [Megaselia abdita]
MRIISPIIIEVLIGLLILVCAEEPQATTEPIQPYEFGFNDGLSTRQEEQTADGVVKGSYSYIDAYGEVQKVSYSADAVNGYVVHTEKDDKKIAIPTAATTIGKDFLAKTYNQGPKQPVEISKIEVVDGHVVDTPEVAAAKARHFKAFREAELISAKDEKKEEATLRRMPAIVAPLVKNLDSVHQNSIPQVKASSFSQKSSYVPKTLDSVHQNAIPQVRFTQSLKTQPINYEDNTIYTPEVAAAREEHFEAVKAAEQLAKDDTYVEPTYVEPTTVATPIVIPSQDHGVYTPEVQAARDEHFRAVQQAELQQQNTYANPTVPSYVPQQPTYAFAPPTPATYSNYVQPTAAYVQSSNGYVQPTAGYVQQQPSGYNTNMYFTPNSAYGLAARVNQYENVPQGQQTYQNYVPQGYQNAYTPLTIFYK